MSPKKVPSEKPKYPSEFSGDPNFHILFSSYDLPQGRVISPDKGTYCKSHEGDLVIFNANIITKTHGKLWYGDLNINLDFDNLKEVADKLKEDLYILMEGDARFGYENQPVEKLMKKARTVIKCNAKYKKEGGIKNLFKLTKKKENGDNN